MASLAELREERLKKLERLKSAGQDPYPTATAPDYELARVLADFTKLEKRKKPLTVVGRVRSLRRQGGVVFFHLDDGSAALQGLIKKDEVAAGDFALFEETVDLGDFVEITGHLFVTKRGEKTILARSWRMLAKSLRPLPGEWQGLADTEERFRRRYLDSLMSPEVKQRFILRSLAMSAIRGFLATENFLEVETPILQPVAGGATAAPFVTHHQALDLDLYLRVAPELYLKKMLVGGFPRVYELGRSFRNEGVDATHNPEFTSLEVYTAFATPAAERSRIGRLLTTVLTATVGGTTVAYGGHQLNFGGEIPTISFLDLLKKYTLINDFNLPVKELELKASQFGIVVAPGDGREKILDNIYKKICRPRLLQPIWILDYPAGFSPLAKRLPDNPELINRFQLVAGGLELVNGFAELNDPVEQAARFAEQAARREGGDAEAQLPDQDYVEALEYGLPPACGWGVGIDRLIMLLTGMTNIREVVFFPTLKPR